MQNRFTLLVLGVCWVGWDSSPPVWPDRAIYLTLGNFLKRLATINLPKSHTFLSNFLKVSKSIICLVKSFLGNFYGHLAIFFWSLCSPCKSVNVVIQISASILRFDRRCDHDKSQRKHSGYFYHNYLTNIQ